MLKRMVSGILLSLLLVGTLASASHALFSETEETMHVKPEVTGILGLVATDWNKTYGGTKFDAAYSLVQTGDGGYALAGQTQSLGAGCDDFWLVKTDSSGNVQWSKTYGGAGNDVAYSLVRTGDGGYALAGYSNSFGAGSADFWLVKTDSSGNMQWTRAYGGTGADYAYSVVRTGDGGYAIAGYTNSFGAGSYDFWLVKTDSSGNMSWSKTYGRTGSEYCQSVVQTADGGYAMAGTGAFGSSGPDFWLIKTDPSGNAQWNKTYGGANYDYCLSAVQTGDGGYALAGYTGSYGAGDYDFWLVKTDSSGNVQWNKTYGGAGSDVAYSVVRTSDGGYALTGRTYSCGSGGPDAWLVKTDSAGNMQWSRTYGGTGYDYGQSVAQTGDGGYAIAGYTNSFGAGSYDFWLVKLTPSTIYIRADGSVDPSTAPIQRNGDLYTLTDNIYTSVDGIVIQRNNMKLDGAGYVLQGPGNRVGIDLSFASNVTVQNLMIKAFDVGISLVNSSKNIIVGNSIESTNNGSIILHYSSYNTLAGNNLTDNYHVGVSFYSSSNNTLTSNNVVNSLNGFWLSYFSSNNFLSGNTIKTSNGTGIRIEWSSNNVLTGNNVTGNYEGILTSSCSGNSIYHNNFVNNWYRQVYSSGSTNVWDEGYPSGGNYWSDYGGTDLRRGPYQNETGSDGIGDAHYVIDVDNQDNFPLMQPWTGGRSTRYPWPMFHNNPTHTGYTESPAPSTNQTRWRYTTGGDVFSSPAVANGRVYFGSNDEQAVRCLDAVTGSQVWIFYTGNLVYSSPAVADGRVYIGSYPSLYCFDAETGSHLWNYWVGNYVDSPAVVDGRVYFGSDDHNVYCLDAVTGSKVWNYTTGNIVRDCPAVVGGRVYFGSYDYRVYCLDAATGLQVWNYTTSNYVVSSPAVVNGRVYFGSEDYNVYCLDAAVGSKVWNYTTGGYVDSSPAVADGRVYVGSHDGNVYCLDATTGALVWGQTVGIVVSSPAVADGRVYVGSEDYKVYCLDAAAGTSIWNYATGNLVRSSPAVADGMVFIGSYDHVIYAFGNVIRFPEDYKTLQKSVDAANPGDTILVAPGVYHESVVINKALTIVGEKGSAPTFSGGGSGIFITLLAGASGTTIAGIVMTNWDQGIVVHEARDCKIYDNIMSVMNQNGVALEGTSASNNLIYANIFEQSAVAVNLVSSSNNNTVYKNIIGPGNTGLNIESSGNTVYANIITQNSVGISIKNSGNTFYHNNIFSNGMQLSISASTNNTWDAGYPSGGNYWSSHTGTDNFNGPQQNIPGSDGIIDQPYTVATNNTDHYPLLEPYSLHNIGITSFFKSKTVVGQSFKLRIEVKIQNLGMYNETSTVTVCANTTILDKQTVSLLTRNSATFTLAWNTAGFAKGNYTISVVTDTVPGETEIYDNVFNSWVMVSIPGDLKCDFVVNILDAIVLANAFASTPEKPEWNPNADINDDGKVNILDAIILANHFLEHYP